jgi:hypothetical protein
MACSVSASNCVASIMLSFILEMWCKFDACWHCVYECIHYLFFTNFLVLSWKRPPRIEWVAKIWPDEGS